MSGKMSACALLQRIGGSLFYQSCADEQPDIHVLLNDRLIQPIKQGKLTGYALTATGYQRWLGHHQVSER